MDLNLVIEKLFPGENVSPDMSSYGAMVINWRGSGTPPTLTECDDAWALIEPDFLAKQKVNPQTKLDALWDKIANDDATKMDEVKAAEVIIK